MTLHFHRGRFLHFTTTSSQDWTGVHRLSIYPSICAYMLIDRVCTWRRAGSTIQHGLSQRVFLNPWPFPPGRSWQFRLGGTIERPHKSICPPYDSNPAARGWVDEIKGTEYTPLRRRSGGRRNSSAHMLLLHKDFGRADPSFCRGRWRSEQGQSQRHGRYSYIVLAFYR